MSIKIVFLIIIEIILLLIIFHYFYKGVYIKNNSLGNDLDKANHRIEDYQKHEQELNDEIENLQNELKELAKRNNDLKSYSEKLLTYALQSKELIKENSNLKSYSKKLLTSALQSKEQAFQPNYENLIEYISFLKKIDVETNFLDKNLLNLAFSNLKVIPYMARIMADYETYGIDILAKQLDWGKSVERKKKVKSLRDLRKETSEMLEKYKQSEYQLAYLLDLYPTLQDILDCEFSQLPMVDFTKESEHDGARNFLSKEEYYSLSSVERNQLALDRYKKSKNKSKWQIGRDYELYVGYKYSLKGYTIDYTGSYLKLEDMGRDLIAKKDNITLVIQCKYWSASKKIHEKHITQLYGTTVCYCLENGLPFENVIGLLVTNITLSNTAKKMASYLKIQYVENYEKRDYPCIKCNIGHNEFGPSKIYHLPFDQQYDSTIINSPGEFYAMTVQEAEDAGFRRAFKWHSS